MNGRRASVTRRTSETDVRADLLLEGSGQATVCSGLGFLDHMLVAFVRHGRFDLELSCRGDLHIDDHHSVEDCALVLGQAFDTALGERRGIARFGSAYVPMDEALARVVIDLSGRPFAAIDLGLRRERLGDVASENLGHFFQSLATAARCTLHVDVLKGRNDHHRAEAAFKAAALAMREAVTVRAAVAAENDVPSTKGVLR